MATTPDRLSQRQPVILPVVGVGLLCFGLMMLAMVAAYTQDLSAITSAPGAVWQFICGAPSRSPLLMPMMVCLSAVAVAAGVALLVWGETLARFFSFSKKCRSDD